MKKTLWRRRFLMGLAVVLTLGGLLFVLRGSIAQSGEYCAINFEWCIKLFNTDNLQNKDERVKIIHDTKYVITNYTGKDIFIPHRTVDEWHRFACAVGNGQSVRERFEDRFRRTRFRPINCQDYGFPTRQGNLGSDRAANIGIARVIDGGWSGYGAWSVCSKPCGTGTQTRTRTCTNPSPLYGGANCSGAGTQSRSCNTQGCPINGGWSRYGSCTGNCGYNRGRRTRSCTNPRPAHGGRYCSGASSQSCTRGSCPISCFVAGTKVILANGTTKNIEDVTFDDALKGSTDNNPVMKRYVIPYKGLVYSFNSGNYFVTPTHPFMTTAGWKSFDPVGTRLESPTLEVSELKQGDILIKTDGQTEVLETFDSQYMETTVYNFGLNGSRDFYADGYWVHNK